MSALHGKRSRKRSRKPQSLTGRKVASSRPTFRPGQRITGHNAKKRELMAQARRAGWRGKTFRGAKKFERRLERMADAKL